MAWIRVLSHQVGIGAVTAGKIADVAQSFENIESFIGADPSGFASGKSGTGWRALTNNIERMLKTDRFPSSLVRAVAGVELSRLFGSRVSKLRRTAGKTMSSCYFRRAVH